MAQPGSATWTGNIWIAMAKSCSIRILLHVDKFNFPATGSATGFYLFSILRMNSFLKKLLIFFVPILLVVFSFEVYLRNIDTLYKDKISGLELRADSIEVLILGNSHACYGINPGQFDKHAFNLAQSNQSLYFDKRLTLGHLDHLVHLKFVLISLDFHSLYFSSQGIRDVWSYYGNGIEYKNQLGIFPKISYIFVYTPQAVISFFKKDFFGDHTAYPLDIESTVKNYSREDNGWVYFEGTDAMAFTGDGCGQRAEAFNKTVNNSDEREESLIDLDDFINKLKQKKIIPVLVSSPTYHEFNLLLDEGVSHRNKQDIDSIAIKQGIQYWDYTHDRRFTKNYFFNCDHLNREGADMFSKELNFRLQTIGPEHRRN